MDTDGMVRFFGRHLVALCVVTRYQDENPRFNAYSGTLIRIDGTLLWLTAGHVIRHLEEALGDDRVSIDSAVFADAFGKSFRSEQPVPIDLRASQRFYRDDDDLGLDFGVVIIHPHHERLLAANGVMTLEDKNWIRQHNVEFSIYWLLGLPAEYSTEFLPRNGAATVSPTMIALRAVEEDVEAPCPTFPRLITEINGPIPLENIRGMSGGPVFGFAMRENGLHYWVVAIQSTWLRQSKRLFACPLPIIAPMLKAWIGELAAKPL